jgi:hypothetical protein
MANLVTVGIRVVGGDATATIKGVNDALAQLGIQAQTISQVGFKQASAGSDTLYQSMRVLKSEAVQHDRVFMYFGRQLASLAPVAKETAGALVGLAAGLASGMWIMAAVEAAKLLASAFKESSAAAAKLKEEMEKVKKETGEFADKALKIDPLTRKWIDANTELNRLLGEQAGVLDFMGNRVEGVYDKEIARQRDLIAQLNEQLRIRRDIAAAVATEETRAAQGPAADKVIAADKERARKAAIDRRDLADRASLDQAADNARRLEAERKVVEDSQEMWDLAHIEQAAENRKRADEELREMLRVQHEGVTAKQRRLDLTDPFAAAEERRNAMRARAEAIRPIDKGAAEELDKLSDVERIHEVGAAWTQIGATMSGAFNDLGTAVGGTFGKMMSMFGKLIQQAIQLAIAISASAGPWAWLNIAATAAALIATISAVPSFEVGTPYVPRTGLAMVHEGERITPASENRAGGGTIVIHAIDAASFESYLKGSGGTALVQAIREHTRNGRI